MNEIRWQPEYGTGIRVIDQDHQGLFDLVDGVRRQYEQGGTADQVTTAIDTLLHYVDEHFEREEKFMADAGYPGFEAHCGEHRKLTDTVLGLSDMYRAAPEDVDLGKVLTFLEEWLKGHILGRDMEYVPYVTGDKEGVRPELRKKTKPVVRRAVVKMEVAADKIKLLEDVEAILAAGGPVSAAFEEVVSELSERLHKSGVTSAHKLFSK